MTDGMSKEDCRLHQRICSDRVHADITTFRGEVREEIAALREAVQGLDRTIAQIKGHLGINGQQVAQYPQRRQSDDTAVESLHKRIDGLVESNSRTVLELRTRSSDGITLPKWAVYASAALLLLIVILAAFAGERSLPVIIDSLGKAHQ